MMGRQVVQEALFYRFRFEDHVPADYFLRWIDWLLNFSAIRHDLEALYSHTGRPSVDPELMIRMLLIGYLYGIRSDRRLVDEGHFNFAYRWFCRLGLESRMPDRSTFSNNRHGRFASGGVLRRVFEMVVDRCAAFGLVGGQAAAVDGSTIAADASRERKDQPEAMQKTWAVKEEVARPVREYLDQLAVEPREVREGPQHKAAKYLSEADPQAA